MFVNILYLYHCLLFTFYFFKIVDLAGWIPTSLVNTVMADEPLYLSLLRKMVTGSED